jgi:hypothetical protein
MCCRHSLMPTCWLHLLDMAGIYRESIEPWTLWLALHVCFSARTGECRDSGWVSLNTGYDLSSSCPFIIHWHFTEFNIQVEGRIVAANVHTNSIMSLVPLIHTSMCRYVCAQVCICKRMLVCRYAYVHIRVRLGILVCNKPCVQSCMYAGMRACVSQMFAVCV